MFVDSSRPAIDVDHADARPSIAITDMASTTVCPVMLIHDNTETTWLSADQYQAEVAASLDMR